MARIAKRGGAPFLMSAIALAVASAVAVAVASCVSPTLPLPPPLLPRVESGATAGVVRLSSERGVQPNALVVVYNRNPLVPLDRRVGGAQADGEGSWAAEVYGGSGDVLDVRQEFGTEQSPPVSLKIP